MPVPTNASQSSGEKAVSPTRKFVWSGAKPLPTLLTLFLGLSLWFSPIPTGLDTKTWHLFTIFVSTIFAIIARPLPMSAVALVSMTLCILSNTLTLTQAMSSFSHPVVWLVIAAFFIAIGFIKTGLGPRIGYFFITLLGKNSIGLAYGLSFTDLLLSMVVPSNTARGAGILFPIVQSLSLEYGSHPKDESAYKIGRYLIATVFHANTISSATFMTALAGNSIAVLLAGQAGIKISWGSWALAAIVPGLLSLIALPLLMYFVNRPQLLMTPQAPEMASAQLRTMGPLKFEEWIMSGTFVILLGLWSFGDVLGVHAATAAFLGVCILLLTGTLQWDDLVEDKNAWTALIWFAILLGMAGFLTEFGMMDWFGEHVKVLVGGVEWPLALALLCGLYFYVHYFFASVTAHITALYSAFLIVALSTGAPPELSALVLAFLSSLSGALTHYGTGPAPAFYGAGYFSAKDWWRTGFIICTFNFIIWAVSGFLWWSLLGLI